MRISVIVPAYNESAYIAETLSSLNRAGVCLEAATDAAVEIIVVDNGSSDGTAKIARGHRVKVVFEPVRSIAKARNSGARAASGDVLAFIDADMTVEETLLLRIVEKVIEKGFVGGSVQLRYASRRRLVRLYLWGWRLLARVAGMAQGGVQFCTTEAFHAITALSCLAARSPRTESPGLSSQRPSGTKTGTLFTPALPRLCENQVERQPNGL